MNNVHRKSLYQEPSIKNVFRYKNIKFYNVDQVDDERMCGRKRMIAQVKTLNKMVFVSLARKIRTK